MDTIKKYFKYIAVGIICLMIVFIVTGHYHHVDLTSMSISIIDNTKTISELEIDEETALKISNVLSLNSKWFSNDSYESIMETGYKINFNDNQTVYIVSNLEDNDNAIIWLYENNKTYQAKLSKTKLAELNAIVNPLIK